MSSLLPNPPYTRYKPGRLKLNSPIRAGTAYSLLSQLPCPASELLIKRGVGTLDVVPVHHITAKQAVVTVCVLLCCGLYLEDDLNLRMVIYVGALLSLFGCGSIATEPVEMASPIEVLRECPGDIIALARPNEADFFEDFPDSETGQAQAETEVGVTLRVTGLCESVIQRSTTTKDPNFIGSRLFNIPRIRTDQSDISAAYQRSFEDVDSLTVYAGGSSETGLSKLSVIVAGTGICQGGRRPGGDGPDLQVTRPGTATPFRGGTLSGESLVRRVSPMDVESPLKYRKRADIMPISFSPEAMARESCGQAPSIGLNIVIQAEARGKDDGVSRTLPIYIAVDR